MRIHYLQHVPFEGLGLIRDWAANKNMPVSVTRIFAGEGFPDINDFDALIIMGGPMGVYDDQKYPWLAKEKGFIKNAIVSHKKLLGICLGSQLIVDALGGKVFKNPEKEIGWFPVKFTELARKNKFFEKFREKEDVFHWHGDSFSLPQGSIPIGSSEACNNQGFIFGDNIIALQFHLEMNKDDIKKLMAASIKELTEKGKYIQTPENILAEEEKLNNSNRLINNLLESFLT